MPTPASPSPDSSGVKCPRVAALRARLRFLTREGVFGRSLVGRFLGAMGASSTPLRLALQRRHGLLEYPRRDRALGHPEVRRVVEDELLDPDRLPAGDHFVKRLQRAPGQLAVEPRMDGDRPAELARVAAE